jgi:ribosomal protein L24
VTPPLAAALPPARPLECGQAVRVHAGKYAGKRGTVREITKEIQTRQTWLLVELDDGVWIRVDITAPGAT